VKFVNTRGGTELGMEIDDESSDFTRADFASENGRLTIVGRLTLDHRRCAAVANIDLASPTGEGYLEPTEQHAVVTSQA
jgi:hypothetical protein